MTAKNDITFFIFKYWHFDTHVYVSEIFRSDPSFSQQLFFVGF
jgi:hypothetical protein